MIHKGMIFAKCDDCSDSGLFVSLDDMRMKGWAIARNRTNCNCRLCALSHRNVGRKGARKPVNGSNRLKPFK